MAAVIIPAFLVATPVMLAAAFIIHRFVTWWPGRVDRRSEPYRHERS